MLIGDHYAFDITIARTGEYLQYLKLHYDYVQQAWKMYQARMDPACEFLSDDFLWFTMDEEIKKHDLSKLSSDEFIPYRDYFYPVAGQVTQQVEQAFERAKQHHIDHNPHHWEHWTQRKYQDDGISEGIFCTHMIIDWVAIGLQRRTSTMEWYMAERDKMDFPGWADRYIVEVLERMDV